MMRKMLTKVSVVVVIALFITGAISISGLGQIYPPVDETRPGLAYTTYDGPHGHAYVTIKEGVEILHLKGTHYQMGYQHGWLTAEWITFLYNTWLTNICWVTGLGDINAGYETFRGLSYSMFWDVIQERAPEYLEEMQGIADGLADRGISTLYSYLVDRIPDGSPPTFDDVYMMTFMLEVFLIIARGWPTPHACSCFAAWGDATSDGKLLFGSNTDFSHMNIVPNASVIIVREPEHVDPFGGVGMPFLTSGHAGMVGACAAMNLERIATNLQISFSANWTDIGNDLPIMISLMKVAEYCDSVEEGYEMLEYCGGSTGWNVMVVDGKVPNAAVIEIAGDEMAMRTDNTTGDTIVSCGSNCYMCYPGFQGYTGSVNMIPGQLVGYKGVDWSLIDTVDKWIAWCLYDSDENVKNTWTRYMRIKQLIGENYGDIDIQKAIDIMSDHVNYWSQEYDPGNMTVCCESPTTSTIRSWVARPVDLDVWVAQGWYPAAQYGPWVHINLLEEIGPIAEGYGALRIGNQWYSGKAALYITSNNQIHLKVNEQLATWNIIKHKETEDIEFYRCKKGLKVAIWTKRKTGETFVLAKGPGAYFFGKAV